MAAALNQTAILITRPSFPKLLHIHNSIATVGKLRTQMFGETSTETAYS